MFCKGILGSKDEGSKFKKRRPRVGEHALTLGWTEGTGDGVTTREEKVKGRERSHPKRAKNIVTTSVQHLAVLD